MRMVRFWDEKDSELIKLVIISEIMVVKDITGRDFVRRDGII